MLVDVRTNDLYLAAFLKCQGQPYRGSVKVGSKTYFVFDNTSQYKLLKRAYFKNGEAPIRAYLRALVELRAELNGE